MYGVVTTTSLVVGDGIFTVCRVSKRGIQIGERKHGRLSGLDGHPVLEESVLAPGAAGRVTFDIEHVPAGRGAGRQEQKASGAVRFRFAYAVDLERHSRKRTSVERQDAAGHRRHARRGDERGQLLPGRGPPVAAPAVLRRGRVRDPLLGIRL